ncbi:MAG: hypothetical protein GXX96_19725 [Planctomycetaceae bacterium]|nr:hypothetical protein [Planctomycetaceae bacterium]
MGDRVAEQPISLAELDARHDDLLNQLEALDLRIQAVLKEHLPEKRAVVLPPPHESGPAPLQVLFDEDTSFSSAGPGVPTC